jgi:hypothetical protein
LAIHGVSTRILHITPRRRRRKHMAAGTFMFSPRASIFYKEWKPVKPSSPRQLARG